MSERGASTINEFCDWSRIGRTKVYECIGNGSLPIVKIGNKTLILKEDGEALLKRNLKTATPDLHAEAKAA